MAKDSLLSIADAKQALIEIKELKEPLLEVIQDPLALGILAAALFWFYINGRFEHAFDFKYRKQKKRLEKYKTYKSTEFETCPDIMDVLREERDAIFFEDATNIRTSRKRRKLLLELNNIPDISVGWEQIKRAYPYLVEAKDGGLEVRDFTTGDKIGYWYNRITGFFFFGLSILLFLIFIASNLNDLLSSLLAIPVFAVGILFATYIFKQNWPMDDAERIKKELERLSKVQAGEDFKEDQ